MLSERMYSSGDVPFCVSGRRRDGMSKMRYASASGIRIGEFSTSFFQSVNGGASEKGFALLFGFPRKSISLTTSSAPLSAVEITRPATPRCAAKMNAFI